jgi:2-hydroxycyclohexanecarboxyl-CoA dehydrogenase
VNLGLHEHVAVIFGAASGIGRAIAEAFAAEGAHVAWLDRDQRVVELAAAHKHALALVADVTDFATLEQARESIESSLGPIRHVVFAVGCGSGKVGFPFWNLEPSDWDHVLRVNLLGAVHVAHAFAPSLAAQRSGTLTFLTSVAGQIGSPTDPPYSAAKAAIINFMQVAARDLAPFGVRANAISPGMVQTPLNRSVWQAWNAQQSAELQQTYDDWAREKIERIAPLGRWQTAEEIAALALYLASDHARNITGQTLNVDGGQVMHA